MKTLAHFATHEEALVARSYLASHDIEAVLMDDKTSATLPHIMSSQGYALLVPDADLEAAREALVSVIGAEALVMTEAPPVPWRAILIVVALLLLAVTIRNLL